MVLECGGIELLLRCANFKLWPDVVTAALWNICAESEVQIAVNTGSVIGNNNPSEGTRVISQSQMSTIACTQLALRSTGECDDSFGRSLLTAEVEDGRRRTNIIKELLDLGDIVKDETRKEMVAELLEKASWHSESTTLMQRCV